MRPPLLRRLFLPGLFALSLVDSSPALGADLVISLADKRGAALADAVVYIDDPKALTAKVARKPVEIRQIWRQFDPFVTVVATGTPVEFPNYDYILHHVYSNSAAKRFEIRQFKGPSPTPIVFDRPGVVTLGCNMHDWMVAYVVVADSPWFAKTDAQGVARLLEVPPGTHRVMAWYPSLRTPLAMGSVAVNPRESPQISYMLDVAPRTRPKAPPHDPLRY